VDFFKGGGNYSFKVRDKWEKYVSKMKITSTNYNDRMGHEGYSIMYVVKL